ncbi:alkane 1-monooxygenase [Shimia sp. MMG029]|uniref:alkane 1-monooxygenase n=1 Tax=Shimia sp. MMG029 TaxID=3021978 RepID=UPI0022FEED8D|nr:alkane 1-monooxygenase [Shimia sp. MMG029]MDA5557061.1 alkane 1-monooxygenase [Shimia sp. MMG029]
MTWFWIATTIPVALLAFAGLAGGLWAVAAVVYMGALVHVMDRLVKGAAAKSGADGEFPSGLQLSLILGILHFPLMAIAVAALAGLTGLSLGAKICVFAAFGLFFGQVSNANAHELIHNAARFPRWLGMWVYISLVFGHHTSAHTKVHHIWVATDKDPNSARKGESFYRFWPRAWFGSFNAGLAAENTLRARATRETTPWHPYFVYVAGTAFFIILAALLAGWKGVLAYGLLATYSTMQLLLSDYVQHYGLRRGLKENGKPEPVGPQHSWNAPQLYTSALMLNAPRHSDHHTAPTRDYPALRLDPESMPILPRSLPMMATLALWPRMWRRVMDPRVAKLNTTQD